MQPERINYYQESNELLSTILTKMVLETEKKYPVKIPENVKDQLVGAQELFNRARSGFSELNELRHLEANGKAVAEFNYSMSQYKVMKKYGQIKAQKKSN
jgi:hypothetical protein